MEQVWQRPILEGLQLLIDAPPLGVADYHRDDHDEGISLVTGSDAQGLQMEDWLTAMRLES